MGIEHAARARAFVGTRFRPQGRTGDGLDCVGLVLATYEIPAEGVRRDYALRGDHRLEAERTLGAYFRRVPKKDARPGDFMLMAVTDDQLHLAVRTEAGFVHAHAGLRRVVETPGEPDWPVLGVYRKRIRNRSR
jgi:hypothetical protein